MSASIAEQIASRQRRVEERLDRFNFPDDMSRPMMRGTNLHFELAGRHVGTACGGIGLIHQLAQRLELPKEINQRLSLFKIHLPYHESDHVMNLIYNSLCGGRCLEDLELRRQDEAYLNSLGADRIPDPTTAGDFCRRFGPAHIETLHETFDVVRQKVWGYHPLGVTLRNTGEVLRVVNRPGNRPPRYVPKGAPRGKRERVKEKVVETRGFNNVQLKDEWVAEMKYRPVACGRAYRLIIVRKNLRVSEPKQGRLFDDYRYFIYITNDWESTPADVVYGANHRCNQENVWAQMKVSRAFHAPLNTLLSNWAYMLIAAQAWNLKAWLALSLPPPDKKPREKRKPEQQQQHEQDRTGLLRMEFRTFVNAFVRIPCQVVRTGRKIVHRLLAWNRWQSVFFRLAARLGRPLRC